MAECGLGPRATLWAPGGHIHIKKSIKAARGLFKTNVNDKFSYYMAPCLIAKYMPNATVRTLFDEDLDQLTKLRVHETSTLVLLLEYLIIIDGSNLSDLEKSD